MRSSNRPSIRRESKSLRVEALEDRHLLSNASFSVEIPRALSLGPLDSSIILVSERQFPAQVRPGVLTLLPGATPVGNQEFAPSIVLAGIGGAGNLGSALLVAHAVSGDITPYNGSVTIGIPVVAGLSSVERGPLGLVLSTATLDRTTARSALAEQNGDPSFHMTGAGPPGFWTNFDSESFDQFARPATPFKTASVLLIGAIADVDSQATPNPPAPNPGREEARIIRALRDSESEVSTVVINADGANAARAFNGQARVRPSTLSGGAGTMLGVQPTSPGDPNSSAEVEASWSQESRHGADETFVESTAPEAETLLLASFNPFDRASIDRAIDDLLGGLGELEVALPSLEEARDLLPHALGTAAALTVVEIVRRKIRGDSEDNEDVMDSGSPGVPSFPDRWALDER